MTAIWLWRSHKLMLLITWAKHLNTSSAANCSSPSGFDIITVAMATILDLLVKLTMNGMAVDDSVASVVWREIAQPLNYYLEGGPKRTFLTKIIFSNSSIRCHRIMVFYIAYYMTFIYVFSFLFGVKLAFF